MRIFNLNLITMEDLTGKLIVIKFTQFTIKKLTNVNKSKFSFTLKLFVISYTI